MKKSKILKVLTCLSVCMALGSCGDVTSSSISSRPSINDTYLAEVEELLDSKIRLEFDENGDFKVMIMADVHAYQKLNDEDRNNIESLIDRENPNLVIFTGDNTNVKNATDLKIALGSMVNYIESKQIPWCHVYGNHDEDSNYKKVDQQVIYQSFDYCVSKAGDEELFGVGNYALPVYRNDSDDIEFIIWALDSGAYLSNYDKTNLIPKLEEDFRGYPNSEYDYIKQNQMDWYKDASEKIETTYGRKIPSLMAFHIPLQENYFAWEVRDTLPSYDGMKAEVVGASAINPGFFDVVKSRGDVKAIVNGHDHINDYMFDYQGVKLCSSPTVTRNTYYNENIMGSRVFTINQDSADNIETYVQYIDERLPKPNKDEYGYFASGTVISDFEKDLDFLHLTEFDSPYNSIHVQGKIEEGKGINGSKGLALTKTSTLNTGNAEVDWSLHNYGKLGDNKYLIAWIDLTGQTKTLDFRKACFGLIENNQYQAPYITDYNNGKKFPLYYLADGSTEWIEKSHGDDGCFGKAQTSSVSGYKGYFAIPISEMLSYNLDSLTKDSLITGAYFYFSFNEPSKVSGNYLYLDNVTLVDDYKNFKA